MSAFKYSRLPTTENTPEFNALDGPSFYSYGVDQMKYKSAFTYNSLAVDSDQDDVPDLPPPTVLCRICSALVTGLCYLAFVLTLPISAWWTVKSVQHYERIVLFRLGRLSAALGPGYVVVLPCIDRWIKVDLRMKAFSVPPQKVITADSATIEIGADVYFRVKDAVQSVSNVQDLNHSTRIICQTLLQKHIGKQNLGDIESDRIGISTSLQVDVNQMTQTWGVEVSRVELSAVKIHSQPNPLFAGGSSNPLSVLGPALFPPGNSNAPVEQLKHYYQLGSQSMEKLVAASELIGANNKAQITGSSSRSTIRTAADMVSAIRQLLNRNLVQEYGYVYKFIVVDETGAPSVYYLDLKTGEGRVDFGEPPGGAADVTLNLSVHVLRELLGERLSAFNAYMTGQLAIGGDLKAAMKLGGLFESLNRGWPK